MALAGTRLHLVELCSIAAPENVCKCSADEVARTCATVPRAQNIVVFYKSSRPVRLVYSITQQQKRVHYLLAALAVLSSDL